MTLEDLRRRMTLREFCLWSALYDRDPWGPERIEWMLGQLTAVLATCHSTTGTFKPADFIPEYGPVEFVERTDEELKNIALKVNFMLGGRIGT